MCRTDENDNHMKSICNRKKKGHMSGESKLKSDGGFSLTSMNSHEVKKEPFSFSSQKIGENEFIPLEHWQCETCRHGVDLSLPLWHLKSFQGNTSLNKNDIKHLSGKKGATSLMAEDEVKVYKRREKKSLEETMDDNYQGKLTSQLANGSLKEKSIGEASRLFNSSNLQSGLITRANRASNIDLNVSGLQIPKEEVVEEKGRERTPLTITNGVRVTSPNMNQFGNAWLFRHLMQESRKSPFSIQTNDWKHLENLLRPNHRKSGQAQKEKYIVLCASQKQKISTSGLEFEQHIDERLEVRTSVNRPQDNPTQKKRKEPVIDLEASKPPEKINCFNKFSGCSTEINLNKIPAIGDHLQNLNPTILPEGSFTHLMMKMTNNLIKDRGSLKVWSEEELDFLWVGVRRHGQGNWVAILGDPSLPFSKHKTIYDLDERWNKERLKVVGHANLPIPVSTSPHSNSAGAQVHSSNGRRLSPNNLLFGGLVNIPQVNGEEDDENLSQTRQPETITISSEGTLSN